MKYASNYRHNAELIGVIEELVSCLFEEDLAIFNIAGFGMCQ